MPTPADALTTSHDPPAGAAEAFERRGFVRLRDVLPPTTLEAYEPEITSKVIELNTMHLPIC